MSPSSRPPRGPSPAIAGSVLITTIVLCAAVGAGIGWLLGAPVALGIVGVFAGFGAGIAVVVNRFGNV